MQFHEFSKNKVLLESTVDSIEKNLIDINQKIDVAAKKEPLLANKVTQTLQFLVNQAKAVLNKVHHDNHELGNLQQQPTQLTEGLFGFGAPKTATQALSAELADMLEEICETVPNCDSIIARYEQITTNLDKVVTENFEEGKVAGRAQAEKEAREFMNKIDKQLARLAQKVDGHIIPEYKNQGYTKGQIKKFKTREKVQSGLIDLFDTIFRNKIKTGELTQEEALTFAEAAANGQVIDMTRLVNSNQGYGSIDDYVNPQYKNVYTKVIDKFLVSMPAGTGGNIGPGEVALAALGNPTEKADKKGDLIVNGVAYEIKGGSFKKGSAGSGGRLNGDKIQNGKSAYHGIEDLLKRDHNKVWKAMNTLAAKGEIKGKNMLQGITQQGTDNWERILNAAGYTKQMSLSFFHDFIQVLVSNYDEVRGALVTHYFDDLLDKAIDQSPEGISLNYTGLMHAITYIQHESYKATNGFDHIMLINKSTRTFLIINNSEDFIEKMKDGTVVVTKGLSLSSSDPQSATFHFTSK